MNNPFASAKPAATSAKPVKEVVIKLGDIVIATRSIWAESTSKIQAQSDLNQMALDNPQQLLEILHQHVGKLTFEYRSLEGNQGESLADVLARV